MMIRQLAASSGPLLVKSTSLSRCAFACAYRVQTYATTAEKPTNTKQKPPAPPKASSAPPPSPSPAASKSPSPAPPKAPAPSPDLPTPHHAWVYENVHPVYEFSKHQEDRAFGIGDLIGHVTKNSYQNEKFKDTIKVGDVKKAIGQLKEKKFSLYGVFDGHEGKFAAEYVKERLPYELVSAPEFATGNYDAALKTAFAAVQKALLASEGYRPESPKYDFTSGTTASVALVTPTTTYFAQLGNSPIIVKNPGVDWPAVLFPQPAPEDLERLRTSDMFLMVNFAPVSDPKDRKEFWQEITQKKDDYHHGVSNVDVFGSLGDSLYEPENLNKYLDAVRGYLDLASKKKLPRKFPQQRELAYGEFHKFTRENEQWKGLEKHISVGERRDGTSWVTNGLIEGTFNVPSNIKHSPLRREPQVTSFPNDKIIYFSLVTDGVLHNKFCDDDRAMREIDKIILDKAGQTRTRMGINYHDWFFGKFGDDISSVIVNFRK